MSLLEVNKLSIRYAENTVLDAVSFHVDRGESVGIVGESGSGKSQTALALLGLLPTEAVRTGGIRFDGIEIGDYGEREMNHIRARRIAMIFQDPMQALNPYLTIGRQLLQVVRRHDIASGDAARASVIAMLQRVGLPDSERQFGAYPHELSGGMRQRAMIASALIAKPDILIADEPTTALDVTVQAQILDLLEAIRDDTALLLITHDLGIVAGRCERLLVLENGQLVESGATTSIFAAPRTEYTKRLLADAPRIDRGEMRSASSGKTVLGVEGANVSYRNRGRAELAAVRDVSLSLRAAETLAIVGESGSGKSSLVRSILGLIEMQSGRVVYAGEPLSGPVQKRAVSRRRELQLIFQDPANALNPQMRVTDLISEPLLIHEPGQTAQSRQDAVIAMLKKVGLGEEMLHRFVHQLSGGQAQRVAIARALVIKPQVLICDEAVAALDGVARAKVLALLRDVQDETGLSLIFISHDLSVVRSISHRVAVMYLGRLVEVAATTQLFSTPQHPYSKALLDASPIPDPVVKPYSAPLQGEIPSPASPPSGCVFHTRCNFTVDECRTTMPIFRELNGGRVACHRAHDIDLSTDY